MLLEIVARRLLPEESLADFIELERQSRTLRYERVLNDPKELVVLLGDHFRPLEAALLPRLVGFESLPPLSVEQ